MKDIIWGFGDHRHLRCHPLAIVVTMFIGTLLPARAFAQFQFISSGYTNPAPAGVLQISSGVCSDSSATVQGGAYVKAGATINIDTNTTITGSCQWWWQSPVSLIKTTSQTICCVENYVWDPTGGTYDYHVFWGGTPAIQNYDSTNPPPNGTPGPYHNILSNLGTYHFTWQTVTYVAPCSDSQYSAYADAFLNALSCEPKWLPPYESGSGAIDVYVPSTLSGLYTPIDNAISNLQPIFAGYGLTLNNRTTSACSGANCITIDAGSMGTPYDCAENSRASINGVTISSGGATIKFTTGTGAPTNYPSWTVSDSSVLQRTATHELLHLFGLDHQPHTTPGCDAASDAVMLDMVLTSCADPVASNENIPTPNDSLALNAIYGGGPAQTCGF